MPVDVEFPDGTICSMPSCRREIKSRQIGGGGQSVFVDEPEYNPDWRFEAAIGGKWFANPR